MQTVRVEQLAQLLRDTILESEAREQERIIKLLEAECERPLDPKWEHYRETCSCFQIALIKGEK